MIGTPTPVLLKKMKSLFRNQFDEYIDSVVSGKRHTAEPERFKVERYLNDLNHSNWEWCFDFDKAFAPLVWAGCNLKFPSGSNMGKPLRLQPWQVFDIAQIYGWVHQIEGYRRFVNVYLEVPRKNGKTTESGALANYMAFSDMEGDKNGATYIAATSGDQAGDSFSNAQTQVLLAKHPGFKFGNSKNNYVTKYGTRKMEAVTSSPKDGRLFHCLIVDEYHQHPNNDVVNSIKLGAGTDKEFLILYITTAGSNSYSVCNEERESALKIVKGIIKSERYYTAIYTVDEADKKNERIGLSEVWEKANPNYNVTVIPSTFQTFYSDALLSPTKLRNFKTKFLDIWVTSGSRWANMEKWLSNKNDKEESFFIEKQTPCYAGLDLASVSDFAAFTNDYLYEGTHYLYHKFWIPESRIDMLEVQLKIPLRNWIDEDLIIATPGPVIDFSLIAEYITEVYEDSNLLFIAGDPWHLRDLSNYMPPWWEEITFSFSQGWRGMSPSIKTFEKEYLLENIASSNKVIDWMMDNVDSKTDGNDNIKLIKPSRDRSSKRIDGVITMVMAIDTANTQKNTSKIDSIEDLFFIG
jgi:phage terminase large subunit-like protein